MASQEFQELLKSETDPSSYLYRIKWWFKLFKLSANQVRMMRQALIAEVGPIYAQFVRKNSSGHDPLVEYQIEQYENRIKTLPKTDVVELYERWSKLKNTKEKDARGHLRFMLMCQISLKYSLNGWLLKKATGKRKLLGELL